MTTLVRLARRSVILMFAVAAPVLVASPARADVPVGWPDQEPVDKLHALLVLAGIPLALFVIIAVAVYVPSLLRGESLAPGGAPALESQWFGGPRSGTKELGTHADSADASDTGGASGRW